MITFTKMHGLSNDFVVLDGPVDLAAVLVRRLCDRRTGVGADGVLAVSASDGAEDVRMQYWNADGSTSEMCGNGLRCVATYARDRGLVAGERFVVDTPAGPKAVVMHARDDVSVDLGPVVVDPENLTLRARSWTRVRVGNPHVVTYVDDPAAAPVVSEGPLIETDPVVRGRNERRIHLDQRQHDHHESVGTWCWGDPGVWFGHGGGGSRGTVQGSTARRVERRRSRRHRERRVRGRPCLVAWSDRDRLHRRVVGGSLELAQN